MKLFVFGSSLTSSYWNGAATYYRGIYKKLADLGFRITFAEPDAYGRQQHRDDELDKVARTEADRVEERQERAHQLGEIHGRFHFPKTFGMPRLLR